MAAAPAEASAATPAKSSHVEKEDNLVYCLAHLAAFDITPMHPQADVKAQTRDNVQLLVNKIFAIEREDTDEGPVAVLPLEEGFRLPRQRPIPKVKPETRWAKFMKERNMEKRKRSRLVFDEGTGDWKPRYGYKSANKNEKDFNGIMEVPDGSDSYANLFDRASSEGKLNAAKQKMREVRNRVEAAGGRLKAAAPDLNVGMRSGLDSVKRGAAGLKEALRRAQVSSGSLGKFDRVAPHEPTNLQPKRRKVHNTGSISDERARYMKAAGSVLSGDGGVDKNKAAQVGGSGLTGDRPVARKEKQPKRRSKQGSRNKGGGKK